MKIVTSPCKHVWPSLSGRVGFALRSSILPRPNAQIHTRSSHMYTNKVYICAAGSSQSPLKAHPIHERCRPPLRPYSLRRPATSKPSTPWTILSRSRPSHLTPPGSSAHASALDCSLFLPQQSSTYRSRRTRTVSSTPSLTLARRRTMTAGCRASATRCFGGDGQRGPCTTNSRETK